MAWVVSYVVIVLLLLGGLVRYFGNL